MAKPFEYLAGAIRENHSADRRNHCGSELPNDAMFINAIQTLKFESSTMRQ